MKKELKKQLSSTRMLMIVFAVLAIISLFNNFAIFSIFALIFHYLRLKAKDFKSRIEFLVMLDKFKL